MQPKMIVTDLDNTLLRTDKTISNFTANILNQCYSKNIKIVFATARSLRGIKEFTDKIKTNAIIAVNGSIVYHNENKILEHIIPEKIKNIVLQRLLHRGVKKIAAEPENF